MRTLELSFQTLAEEGIFYVVQRSEDVGGHDGLPICVMRRVLVRSVGPVRIIFPLFPGEVFATYALERWLMKTIALLLMARMAFAWIWVLGGRTPLARRVMMDLGRLRSYQT